MKKPILILNASHNGSTIDVSLDQTVILQLEENGSTGYIWSRELLSPETIEMYESTLFLEDPETIGGGGIRSYKFRFLKPGKALVWLNLLRPWEKGKPPIETFQVTLLVNITPE